MTANDTPVQRHGREADLTIVIVTYQVRDLARGCLRAVAAATRGPRVDTFVVDNASTDGTVAALRAEFPWAHVIDAGANLGFTGGNNLVLERLLAEGSAGRYVLLLNPDTEVEPGTFDEMLRFMEATPAAGAATCRLELPSGELDWACHRGFPTPWSSLTYLLGLERLFPRSRCFARYHLRWHDLATTHEIDAPSGAFFLVRRETFETVGALDPAFFMYGEDLDLAYRIRQAGWRIYYHPKARTLHYKGASSGLKRSSRRWSSADAARRRATTRRFFGAMRIFYDKHQARRDPAPLRLAVRAGIGAARRLALLRLRLAEWRPR